MGRSSSFAELGVKIGAFERELGTIPARGVAEAALFTKRTVLGLLGAPAGMILSGVGKNGARIGVRYDVKGTGDHATALVRATGPFHLIERDTSPHDIPRTQGSRRLRTESGRLSVKREATGRKRSGRKVLKMPGGFATGPVRHPGTKGRHVWRRGIAIAEQRTKLEFQRGVSRGLEKAFR